MTDIRFLEYPTAIAAGIFYHMLLLFMLKLVVEGNGSAGERTTFKLSFSPGKDAVKRFPFPLHPWRIQLQLPGVPAAGA